MKTIKDSTYAAIETRLEELGLKYKFGHPLNGVFFEGKDKVAVILRMDSKTYEATIYSSHMNLPMQKEKIELQIQDEIKQQPRNQVKPELTSREEKMIRMLDKLIDNYKRLMDDETSSLEAKIRFKDTMEAYQLSKTLIHQLHNMDDKMNAMILESYLINLKKK